MVEHCNGYTLPRFGVDEVRDASTLAVEFRDVPRRDVDHSPQAPQSIGCQYFALRAWGVF